MSWKAQQKARVPRVPVRVLPALIGRTLPRGPPLGCQRFEQGSGRSTAPALLRSSHCSPAPVLGRGEISETFSSLPGLGSPQERPPARGYADSSGQRAQQTQAEVTLTPGDRVDLQPRCEPSPPALCHPLSGYCKSLSHSATASLARPNPSVQGCRVPEGPGHTSGPFSRPEGSESPGPSLMGRAGGYRRQRAPAFLLSLFPLEERFRKNASRATLHGSQAVHLGIWPGFKRGRLLEQGERKFKA